MHQSHIKTRRPNRCPSFVVLKSSSVSLLFLLVLLVSVGSEAIVKQQQQRSDEVQQQTSSSSGSSSISSNNNNNSPNQQQSAAYNNHKSPALGSSVPNSVSVAQPSQPSYSSSVSVSSSSSGSSGSHAREQPSSSSAALNAQNVQNPAQASAAIGQQQQSSRSDQLSSYANYNPGNTINSAQGQKYADNMAAAASNPDQSYQAAASSVNLALANSGIFGPSGAGNQMGANSANSPSLQASSGSQSLNPLHYFYYPAKDSGSSANQAKSSAADIMSNAASSNYQSLAYPSYSDQLNSALSSLGSGPEAAASSQDPSYLPQPGSSGAEANLFGNQQQQQVNQQQQQNGGPHQNYNADLASYQGAQSQSLNLNQNQNLNMNQNQNLNQQNQQQVSAGNGQQQHGSQGGISFSGPSSGNQVPTSEYLNSHNHQQIPQLNGYQNNLYNQLGDLSTSNFGNNAGGLSSVASYMSPNQADHASVGGSQHDTLFSGANAASLQQFNSAASQLSPASVSPPSGAPSQQGAGQNLAASSLFNAASSLFGQQAPNVPNNNNNLFSNQHYLNSFLTPQQYNQLTGQQQPADALSTAASSPAASSVASASGSSSKRFGISSFIMPMLALAGLSLLIPTMSNIGTAVGRKKRSIADEHRASGRQQQVSYEPMNGASQLAKEMSIGEYMEKIERYYSIYKNAVESDDCLNRLICEFGHSVKDVTGKNAVVTVIEKLVPTWMTGKVHLFKEAALDNKEGKEKCKKYICHSNKHQRR